MYDQIDNSKVSSSDTNKTVLTESGTFLVSAETKSYSGTCNITAARVGASDQCTINVSGLGRRPPTLKKNDTVVTGFSWTRAPSTNYDAFTATTTCEKTQPSTFKAQSAAGSDFCEAAPVAASLVITIPGITSSWIDTGLSLAGQTFRITVTGSMNLASGIPSWEVGPDGRIDWNAWGCGAMGTSAAGAALGKIGSTGTPFLIGSSYSSSTGTSGTLYLGHNDMVCPSDNTGSFTATISWP
jgi:hypothetical protein